MDVSEVLLARSLRESPSTDDLRVRLRRQGGQSRLAPRPSSADALGVGPEVGHRGMGTEELPVCEMFSEQFNRMKTNVPYVRPQSAYTRTPAQQSAAALAESEVRPCPAFCPCFSRVLSHFARLFDRATR